MPQAHHPAAPPATPLTTARLLLRPLVLEDAAAIQRHFPHWEIVRFVNGRVPWPYPADGALTYLRDIALPAMARGEEWHWSIRLKDRPDDLIGAIALMAQEGNNRGFWLGLPWQGQGLMSEAVEAVTDFWFEELGREVLRVPKAAANRASRRVSERTGMRVIRTEMHAYVSGEHLSEVWEITREEWRARKSPRPAPQGEGG
ncbi:GNAT family N-acetyltransferase [Azospirillum canadense]|uniref:GNAT family N-acetyltransferase n=1 Tax=Azospirillum canadense TaxID=403962 RepID=UPI0022270235|nr:GNAT family N-acetyltransferase [Azospirillum canadense]MCW2235675.1 RimJ/RimL family protein N-acetyltransferase [Azospirillum canadense]